MPAPILTNMSVASWHSVASVATSAFQILSLHLSSWAVDLNPFFKHVELQAREEGRRRVPLGVWVYVSAVLWQRASQKERRVCACVPNVAAQSVWASRGWYPNEPHNGLFIKESSWSRAFGPNPWQLPSRPVQLSGHWEMWFLERKASLRVIFLPLVEGCTEESYGLWKLKHNEAKIFVD